MLLKRLFDENLAQASYLVGAETSDAAIVIDPNRNVEQYVEAAAHEKRRITHVTETHIHADFVSGARELARRTGAQLLLSGEGGSDWQYQLGAEDAAVLLMDGDRIQVGEVIFDVLHTPGHTPEHLVLFMTDSASADRPMGLFTGDFIFVGDVGRPDLLERAAQELGSMESSGRALFQSLRRMRAYPDYLQLWPGHGAGSACGKALGAMPSSTLGYEKLFNWAFQVENEEEFVRLVLTGQPEPPRYFARMKRINRDGPPPRGAALPHEPLDAGALARALGDASAIVVDTRPSAQFAAGFIPGTLNIPNGSSFATWAGSLLPADRDIVLLVPGDGNEGASLASTLASTLALVGIDRVIGWAGDAAFEHWRRGAEQHRLERMPTIDAAGLAAQVEDPNLLVLDVRSETEWDAGRIPGAVHLFLGDLPEQSNGLRRDRPIVVACQGGTRSSIAASLLRARGFENVTTMPGGFAEWSRAGLAVETPHASAETR